ncbi:hypothetical protein [Persephonella sp.]
MKEYSLKNKDIIPLRLLLSKFKEKDIENLLKTFHNPLNQDVEDFLHNKSIDFEKRGISRTFIFLDNNKPKVLAFFSLALEVLHLQDIKSKNKRKKLAKGFDNKEYIPVFLIAQLGKSHDVKKGEGKIILETSIIFVKRASDYVGGKYVFLDIIKKDDDSHQKLLEFYLNYGFTELMEIKTEEETLIRLVLKF